MLHSEKPEERSDLNALKVKIQCPAMTLPWGSYAGSLSATAIGARFYQQHMPQSRVPSWMQGWGWGKERAHKRHGEAGGPSQDRERSGLYNVHKQT